MSEGEAGAGIQGPPLPAETGRRISPASKGRKPKDVVKQDSGYKRSQRTRRYLGGYLTQRRPVAA